MKTTCLAALISALLCSPILAAPLTSGLDSASADPAVRPQDDLFRAANGGWLAKTAIPADKASFGAFIQLRDLSDERVKSIVEEVAAKKSASGSVEDKVAAFYRSYVDTKAIDAAGLKPLEPTFKEIEALKDKKALAAYFGRQQSAISTPISLGVSGDFKNPDRYMAMTWQDGLGMPDRDYYLKADDVRLAKARAAYQLYLETLFRLAGDRHAVKSAKIVYALENQIAESHWDKADNRNPVKLYNPFTVAELANKAPGIDWRLFLKTAAFPDIDTVNISQPSQVFAVAKLVQEVPLTTWKLYLKARALDAAADTLPQAFREARFAFHGKALSGTEQEKPRWQQATAQVNGALGEAVGQIYVAKYFPPAYKARMQELVGNLLKAYGNSIDGLTWMTPATKAQAKEKLSKYMIKIGYPDNWRDYSKLVVRDGDALGNARRAVRFEYERQARRVHDKVDRTEWAMNAQTVNAYYNPNLNEIVFPAAILQPPFFDMKADDAVNYGAIGAVIGHEISHGFDDEGSQFDGDGKLRNWWTEADRKAFDAIGAKLIAQYEGYEPIPGKHINGKLTQGENLADLSGLQIALKAYKLSLNGRPAPVIDGLTGEQRFFLGWAQAWRNKTREQALLQQITIDPHSPAEFRANGAAVNNDGFHEAFGTQPGDRLYKAPEQRIRVW